MKRKLKKEWSALPNANRRGLKDVRCTELVVLRWLLGRHARLEDGKINLEKAPETNTKDNSSAGRALYYFVWRCPKWKSKISVMLSPGPCTFQHTLFLDITQREGNRGTHTIDISLMQGNRCAFPTVLRRWTQPWHCQRKPLWNELMSQPDFLGGERKVGKNGML